MTIPLISAFFIARPLQTETAKASIASPTARINNSVNFGRLLKPSEEADYASVLERAKAKAGNRGKTILIAPSSSLPQADINNTGVGNLASNEGFFDFVKKYCPNTDVNVIDHGVNLDKFKVSTEKDNSFVVCSQLIERKKIDGILEKFAKYLKQYDSTCLLYIIGGGELKEKLQIMAQSLGIAPNVIFTGKMTHDELFPILSRAKALLVNTMKDNNMISIVEAIAVGTPIVTTDVPLNSIYIKEYQLGIAKKQWDESDLNEVVSNSEMYVGNCIKYRYKLSTKQRVEQFLEIER